MLKEFAMKKFLLVLFVVAILSSCVSITDREMSVQDRANYNVAGKVTTTFTSFQFFHIPSKGMKEKAYRELLKKAQAEYGDNADVRNIIIEGSFSVGELIYPLGFAAGSALITSIAYPYPFNESMTLLPSIAAGAAIPISLIIGNIQKITAIGDVVVSGKGVALVNQQRLEGALDKAVETLVKNLPQNANIAILNMESSDVSAAKYAVDELEFKLVNSKKFRIVDRRRIDQILNEQKFQISGDVDDNSAVSIGKILGANIVITGSISGSGNSQRLFLRVLDVQTAQITTMVREQF
jgi:PBP1b-binding outer membrane lipoprotein LpoB